jgi:plasmid stabilization system protein ParE
VKVAEAFHSHESARDLEEIAFHIAVTDSRPLTAKRIVEELIAKCDFYANSPLVGTAAEELFEGCRHGRHKRWVIFYRERPEGIDVVRIVDGARDYPSLFR